MQLKNKNERMRSKNREINEIDFEDIRYYMERLEYERRRNFITENLKVEVQRTSAHKRGESTCLIKPE